MARRLGPTKLQLKGFLEGLIPNFEALSTRSQVSHLKDL